ncbi:MAG TPA: MTAP family purine nucleoside phosphorylase [Chthonomonadaceae bacterium]|nr:MTAP family purine nucleoside phosphorylase [Chthonomonadaceae bacterium]
MDERTLTPSSSPGNIAIIGGTGFETLPPDIFAEPIDVETPAGPARVLSVADNYTEPFKLFFLARHGPEHGLAPHEINYRANILALLQLEARYAFATNAVGSLRTDLPPGAFVLLDDFIDFTKRRDVTLYCSGQSRHTDFSLPYSSLLRSKVAQTAREQNIGITPRGTYLCCDGPRFESPAEVRLFRSWGADVVGMTGLPEAIFAREAGIEYAALAIVTNIAAGLSDAPVSHDEVVASMAGSLPLLRDLCIGSAHALASDWSAG